MHTGTASARRVDGICRLISFDCDLRSDRCLGLGRFSSMQVFRLAAARRLTFASLGKKGIRNRTVGGSGYGPELHT